MADAIHNRSYKAGYYDELTPFFKYYILDSFTPQPTAPKLIERLSELGLDEVRIERGDKIVYSYEYGLESLTIIKNGTILRNDRKIF